MPDADTHGGMQEENQMCGRMQYALLSEIN